MIKPKTTEVQTLLFTRPIWNARTAKAWAKKHGFRYGDVDETEAYIRLRQEPPEMFQAGTFRTIPLSAKHAIQAVIARPWIKKGNPHPRCVLFDEIHKDWRLHKRKHEIFGRLAKAKGTGAYTDKRAVSAFKPLVISAAKQYRRKNKIRPPVSVVFPPDAIGLCTKKLIEQFVSYWKKGQLDQYLLKKTWRKRQEK